MSFWEKDAPVASSQQDMMSGVDPAATFGTDDPNLPHIDIHPFWASDPEVPIKSEAKQIAGLTGRAAVQAVPSAIAGLPALGLDAYDSLVNLTRLGYNTLAPDDNALPLLPAFRHGRAVADLGEKAANLIGLPQPETKMQQGLTDIGSAALGAAGGAGLASKLGALVGDAPALAKMLQSLGDAPLLQSLGAVGSVGASNLAREGNLPPWAQLGFGLVGSIVPGAGVTALERGALGAKSALIDPFTQPGKNVIAGTVLNRLATNPEMARQRMAASEPMLPGSIPTMSQVSRDAGLISSERPMVAAGGGTGRIEQRQADQNLSRNQALDHITLPSRPVPEGGSPTKGTLEYAQAKRDAAVDQNMEPAFRASREGRERFEQMPLTEGNYGLGFADTKPVLQKMDEILATTKGARKDVQDAMSFAKERLTQPTVDVTDPEVLYSIRKDLQNARDGKYNSEKSNLSLARGELADVITALDGAINKAAPGYQRYLSLYSKRSRVLDQQEAITGLRDRGRTAVTDPIHQQPSLTMGKFGTQVRKGMANGSLGKGVGNGNLSEPQLQILSQVTADIDRGSAAQASTMRPPGSDTFKNYTVANIIGRVLGKHIPDTAGGKGLQTIARPLQWMYQLPDEAIGSILVEAALDPKLAARLMRQATQYEVESVAKELAYIAAKQGLVASAHKPP